MAVLTLRLGRSGTGGGSDGRASLAEGGWDGMTDSQIREELNRLVASITDAKDELLEDDGKLGCAHVIESVAGECFTLAERIRNARQEEWAAKRHG